MRKPLLYLLLIASLTFITYCSHAPDRELKPYNPSKAGATIEQSFNISNSIGLKQLNNNTDITTRFALALYNDSIYICISERIFVFDKDTFKKTKEIKINFPKMPYPNDRPGRNIFSLIITNDETAFLRSSYSTSPEANLWLLDLSTGNVVLVNFNYSWFSPSFDLQKIKRFRLGHNRKDDTIIFLTDNIYSSMYDPDVNKFFLLESKPIHRISGSFDGVSIFDDIIWYCGHNLIWEHGKDQYYEDIEIQKFHIDNEEALHTINVEYLNTLTLPQSHLYDPPYIWLMVDRNNRVEMLKLLPND